MPLRVLVVDDESLIRWSLAEALGTAGHIVGEAADAATARRAIAEALDPFDVILLDFRMPDSQDLALLADMRRKSPTSAIVLISASLEAIPALEHSALALGASLALAKPINIQVLEHLVLTVHRAMRRDLRPTVLECGDHACAIHADPNESVTLIADFITEGLLREEQCWYIPAPQTRAAIDRALRDRGVDVDGQFRRGALRVKSPHETYLQDGSFEPRRTIDSFAKAADEAVQDGFSALRAVGDMSWVHGVPDGFERVVQYEAALKTMFATSRVTALCLYHRKQMPLAVLDAVLGTHPIAGLAAGHFANPFYQPGVKALSAQDSRVVTAKLQLFGLQ